ncbi:bifunctional hydroxymethylpyrimidine kinase/phosphomethylpyrimidine kinase [Vandammella animalimorsus]|uniref:bifunctional hydroxymethylpyrimidine kinase/phosphomethylpyrimidine kinase n=1 Tax=Vandammella animalimorsus TaxID=2029117 RepID=UPI0031BAC65D
MNSASSPSSTGAAPIAPRIPRVLSIAGTDPTGGAGVQADLKSIAANGGYGMAVVTALVAQNTQGVRSIHVPPMSFLREQLDAVSDDVRIDALKIGMLGTVDIIATVADWLAQHRPPVLVLDPVMVATSGDRLLDAAAEDALRALLHQADLITPNMPELAVLADAAEASDWPQVLQQAQQVANRYQVHVLAKGGHLQGALAPDALVTPEGNVQEFPGERIATRNTHGTGCSYSAALATLRPQTANWAEAVARAKAWLTESIRHADALQVGQGHGPISHFATLWRLQQARG